MFDRCRTEIAKVKTKEKEAEFVRNYMKPSDEQNELMKKLREEKVSEKELRD
jgi:hypothetical protein